MLFCDKTSKPLDIARVPPGSPRVVGTVHGCGQSGVQRTCWESAQRRLDPSAIRKLPAQAQSSTVLLKVCQEYQGQRNPLLFLSL